MPKSTKGKLDKLDALVAEHEHADPGISVTDFAKRYNMSNKAAESRIQSFVTKGKLIQGWSRSASGRRIRVYRFPEDKVGTE